MDSYTAMEQAYKRGYAKAMEDLRIPSVSLAALRQVCEKALSEYGPQAQMVMVMEECSELMKEISKAYRGKPDLDHISEEMADVLIMLCQMMLLFKNESLVFDQMKSKSMRLANRLGIKEYTWRLMR